MCMQSVYEQKMHRRQVSDYTHMSGVRSPQSLSLVRVSVLLLSHRCTDSRGGRKTRSSSPNRKAGGQAEISPLTLPPSLIHTHTLVHRHSHTVSSMSAASQQQVSEDRGHLCAGPLLPPSSPPPLATFVGGKTGREERADSLPLSSYVHRH